MYRLRTPRCAAALRRKATVSGTWLEAGLSVDQVGFGVIEDTSASQGLKANVVCYGMLHTSYH